MKKRKFLIKLVFAYGVIVLLYTVVATGVYFQKSIEMRNDRLSSSQKQYMLQVRDKIDTQVTVALNLVQQLKWNERLLQYVRDDEKDYYNITKIHYDLQTMANSFSNYGLIIGVQKLSDDFIISSMSTSKASNYFADLTMNEYKLNTVKSYLENSDEKETLVLHNDSSDDSLGKFFSIVKKESITSGEEMAFYISFPTEAIIPPLTEQEQRGFAVSVGNRLVSISSNEPELLDNMRSFNALEAETPFGYTSTQQGDFVLHTVGSMVLPDTKYNYLTQNEGGQVALNYLLRESMLIFLCLTLTGVVVIWVIAMYTYRPYSRAMQANEALLEITEKSKLSLKQSLLRDWMFGRLTDAQIQEGLRSSSLDDVRLPAAVVILEMTNYREWSEQLSSDGVRKATAQLQILIREHLKGVQHELLEVDIMRFPVIVFGLESEELEPLIVKLTSSIEEVPGLGLEWTAVIGKSVPTLEQLHDSYQKALNLLEFQYARSSKAVITMEQLGNLIDADYYYPLDAEKELILHIVRGKQEQAIALIDKIVHENLDNRDLSSEAISQFLFALTATVNRVMQQMNWKKDDVFDEDYQIYSELVKFESKLQLSQKITDLFHLLLAFHQEKSSGEYVLADELFDFIHNNYHQDLGLQTIADHFKLSQGYVGRMFKERTGENFKDYLNMYRVQMAKKLLDEKYIRIEDLSRMVGCNNAITFTRMFKKYEGISPSQYGKKK